MAWGMFCDNIVFKMYTLFWRNFKIVAICFKKVVAILKSKFSDLYSTQLHDLKVVPEERIQFPCHWLLSLVMLSINVKACEILFKKHPKFV